MKMKLNANWKKLGAVCEKPEYGYTTSAIDEGVGPRFLRTTDITEGDINWGTVPFCKVPPTDEAKYLLRDGDILISRAGSVGSSIIIQSPPRAVFASYLIRFRPKEILDPSFAGFFLKSNYFWNQLKTKSSGTTLTGVNASNLSEILVPVPSLSIQNKVVALLKECESVLEKRRQTIRLADEFLKSTFLEMFGDPIKNSQKWDKNLLGELSKRITKGESPKWQGFSYENEGIRFITSENVFWGYVGGNLKYISEEFHKKLNRSQLSNNDVLINLVGASIGRSGIVTADLLPANINQAVAVITLNREKLNPIFLLYQMIHPALQATLLKNAVEVARANISLTDLRDLEVVVPPLPEQNKFADLVQKVKKYKEKLKQSEQELQNLFNSLMQRAFKGELFKEN